MHLAPIGRPHKTAVEGETENERFKSPAALNPAPQIAEEGLLCP
ncbi:MAG TPA: hypothetical protein PKJ78_00680 [Candidatus Hydrogenedentes bacterium]|nr:hypothetical protein [Candidatus Hydrogenedentota bacterium]